jgi:hypothetical protein
MKYQIERTGTFKRQLKLAVKRKRDIVQLDRHS